jgi:branched-chain amino acid transport system substrate-binding protein
MVNDKVAAVVVNASNVAGSIFTGLGTSGIPFFLYSAASQSILTSPNAYSETNVFGALTSPIKILQDKKVTKLAIVVIDSPEAIAGINGIKPFYLKVGITLDVIRAPASTADLSPQVQQAISNGDQAFMDIAVPRSLIAIKQSGFKGPVFVIAGIEKADAASVPGGVAGMYITTGAALDPTSDDYKLMTTIMTKYVPNVTITPLTISMYSTVLGFVNALEGASSAVDAKTVHAALDTMKPTKIPVGGGTIFQCGTHPVSFIPAVCTTQSLIAVAGADGAPMDFQVVDSGPFLKL